MARNDRFSEFTPPSRASADAPLFSEFMPPSRMPPPPESEVGVPEAFARSFGSTVSHTAGNIGKLAGGGLLGAYDYAREAITGQPAADPLADQLFRSLDRYQQSASELYDLGPGERYSGRAAKIAAGAGAGVGMAPLFMLGPAGIATLAGSEGTGGAMDVLAEGGTTSQALKVGGTRAATTAALGVLPFGAASRLVTRAAGREAAAALSPEAKDLFRQEAVLLGKHSEPAIAKHIEQRALQTLEKDAARSVNNRATIAAVGTGAVAQPLALGPAGRLAENWATRDLPGHEQSPVFSEDAFLADLGMGAAAAIPGLHGLKPKPRKINDIENAVKLARDQAAAKGGDALAMAQAEASVRAAGSAAGTPPPGGPLGGAGAAGVDFGALRAGVTAGRDTVLLSQEQRNEFGGATKAELKEILKVMPKEHPKAAVVKQILKERADLLDNGLISNPFGENFKNEGAAHFYATHVKKMAPDEYELIEQENPKTGKSGGFLIAPNAVVERARADIEAAQKSAEEERTTKTKKQEADSLVKEAQRKTKEEEITKLLLGEVAAKNQEAAATQQTAAKEASTQNKMREEGHTPASEPEYVPRPREAPPAEAPGPAAPENIPEYVPRPRYEPPPGEAPVPESATAPAIPAPEPGLVPRSKGAFPAQRVSVADLKIDPKTYQFRTKVEGKSGTDKRLEGVKEWDDKKAGNILVHERLDGTQYVADGHHRVELAKKSGVKDMSAIVLKEADGWTPQMVRVEAATNNMAADNGTATDAAKIYREAQKMGLTPEQTIEKYALPNNANVRDGAELAKLHEDVFTSVVNGAIEERDGAAIGRNFDKPEEQLAAAKIYMKHKPANRAQSDILAQQIKAAGFTKTTQEQGGLFGSELETDSLLGERTKLLDMVGRSLAGDKKLFAKLNIKADVIEAAGNRISRDKNTQMTAKAAAAQQMVADSVYAGSPIKALLDAASAKIKEHPHTAPVVAAGLKQEIVNALNQTAATGRRSAKGSTERAASPASAAAEATGAVAEPAAVTAAPAEPVAETPVPERAEGQRADVPVPAPASERVKPAKELRARLKELHAVMKPLAEKGDLTAAEAETFRQHNKELRDIHFQLGKPGDLAKVKDPGETLSDLPPEVVVTAHDELRANKKVYDRVTESAEGVFFGAETALDKVVRGADPELSNSELTAAFDKTRAVLRSQYGDTMTLYRATGKQINKPTTNWATTEAFAKQFGDKVISREVPIDDIVAVNVHPDGMYHEIIVAERAAPTRPATRDLLGDDATQIQQQTDHNAAVREAQEKLAGGEVPVGEGPGGLFSGEGKQSSIKAHRSEKSEWQQLQDRRIELAKILEENPHDRVARYELEDVRDQMQTLEDWGPSAPRQANAGEKLYSVHVQKKFPSWNEKEGYDVEVSAKSKADANRQVRDQYYRDQGTGEGPVYFTAKESEIQSHRLEVIRNQPPKTPLTKDDPLQNTPEPIKRQRKSEVARVVERLTRDWSNAPEHEVIHDSSELTGEVQQAWDKMAAEAPDAEPPTAFMFDGKMYVIAAQHGDPRSVIEDVYHETSHYGMYGKFGKELDNLLDDMLRVRKGDVLAMADRYKYDVTDPRQLIRAAEEVVAHLAQTNPKLGWVQQMISAIRNHVRGVAEYFGKDLKYTDEDIIQKFILPARQFVEGKPSMATSLRNAERAYQKKLAGLKENLIVPHRRQYTDTQKNSLDRLSLTPDDRPVATRVRETYNRIRDDTFDNLKGRVLEQFADRGLGLKLLDQAYEQATGTPVPAHLSGYVGERLATSPHMPLAATLELALPQFKDGVIQEIPGSEGLLPRFQPVADQLTDYLGWQAGKRAQYLKAQGRENNLTDQDIQTLLALPKTPADEKLFEQTATKIREFHHAILKLGEDGGIFSPGTADHLTKTDPYYIPFFRVDPDGDLLAPHKKGSLANQTSPLKKLRGGENPVGDPMENMMINTSRVIEAVMNNTAAAKGLVLAVPLGIARPATAEAHSGNTVSVFVDGQKQKFEVSDQPLFRALTNIRSKEFNYGLLKVLPAAKQLLTRGVTAAPTFAARNIVRDSVVTWMLTDDKNFIPLVSSVKGLADSLTLNQSQKELMFAGASFMGGYNYHGGDPKAAAEAMRRALRAQGLDDNQTVRYLNTVVNTGEKFWGAYRRVLDAAENANRLAVYEAKRKTGASVAESAFESKDLMDFSNTGASPIFGMFADVVPFLNAGVQGLYKTGRALNTGEGYGKLLNTTMVKGYLLAGLSTALYLANKDDSRYQELANWDKDANWHFWLGAGEDQHYRIPKPFELGFLFGTIPERLARITEKQDNGNDFVAALGRGLTNSFRLNFTPHLFKPAQEVKNNYSDFYQRQIEPVSMQGLLLKDKYEPRTSRTARVAAEGLESATSVLPKSMRSTLSPVQLEYLWRGYTGTMGGYALAVSDALVRAHLGEPQQTLSRDDIPIVQAFHPSDRPRSTVFSEQFYDLVKQSEAAQKSLNKAKKEHNVERRNEIRGDYGDTLRARKALNKKKLVIARLRAQQFTAKNNPNLPAEVRDQIVNSRQLRINALERQAVEKYRPMLEPEP